MKSQEELRKDVQSFVGVLAAGCLKAPEKIERVSVSEENGHYDSKKIVSFEAGGTRFYLSSTKTNPKDGDTDTSIPF